MLSPADLIAADTVVRTIQAKARGYIPHKPHPKQAEFLALDCREALYGGAAGGGKSDALLMGALEYVTEPGYAALILRRTFRDLNQPDAIMARSHEWLRGTDARWNDNDKRWTFPSGATLTFGYLDTDKDRYQYQGAALQFIGWDELTQFPEGWYRWLFSRLRRLKGSRVPLRVRAATNPGGIGHEWVRRRFVNPGNADKPFIPAKLDDNPSIDAADYLESLAELDSTSLAQLRDGVWIRDAEGLVYRFDETLNLTPAVPECQRFVLGIDYGTRSPTAFVVLGWRVGDPKVYVHRAWKVPGMSPSEAGEAVRDLEATYKFVRIVGDTGGLGAGYAEEARRRFKLPIEPAEKQNKLGYIKLLNGELERGRIKVLRSECEPLITEWLELPWHEGGEREREAAGFDNHCADAMLYAWRAANAFYAQEMQPGEMVSDADEARKAKVSFLEGRRKERERREKFGAIPVTHQRRPRLG